MRGLFERTRRRHPRLVAAVALGAAVLLAYGAVPRFVWIDQEDFRTVLSGASAPWGALVSPEYFKEFSPTYRPAAMLWHRLSWLLFGERVELYAWPKLFLVWASSLVLFEAARQRIASPGWSLAAALLYATHPVHAGTTMKLAFVDDTLIAFFCLLSLVASRRLVESEAGAGWRVVLGASALGAFLSKETSVILPLLVAWDAWLARPAGGRRARLKAFSRAGWPLLTALVAAGGLAAVSGCGRRLWPMELSGLEPWWRPAVLLARYLEGLIPWPAPPMALTPGVLIGLAAAASAGVGLGPAFFFLGLVILGILPVLGIVATPDYHGTLSTVIANRMTFPVAGFCLLAAAAGGGRRLPRWGRALSRTALVALIAANALDSMARARSPEPRLQAVRTGEFLRPGYPFAYSEFNALLASLPVLKRLRPDDHREAVEGIRLAVGHRGSTVADLFSEPGVYAEARAYKHMLNALSYKGFAGLHRELARLHRDWRAEGGEATGLRYARRLQEAVRLKDEGVDLFLSGDVEGAREALKGSLSLDPDNPESISTAEAIRLYDPSLSRSSRSSRRTSGGSPGLTGRRRPAS